MTSASAGTQAYPSAPRPEPADAAQHVPEAAGETNRRKLEANLRFVLRDSRDQAERRETARHDAYLPPVREADLIEDDERTNDRTEPAAELAIQPRQVATIKTLDELRQGRKETILLQSGEVRIIQLVVQAGGDVPVYEAAGAMILQSLDGHVLVCVRNQWQDLKPRQLLYLTVNEPFSIHGITESSLLLTIISAKEGQNVQLIG